ncbi:uncharacterized protein A4U43_C09F13180 [Asparagus officinalis]|uniref:Uncharacterized protein n=1 Tax=Asparagus officinalis TaxID=4686 RepID=A0A5P1EC18_ASPOF|nr:uncharacterized protein A4U43_C09F13180 [Asparagus officinalis]
MNIDKSNDHTKAVKDKSVNEKSVESSNFLVNNPACGINVKVSAQTTPDMMNIGQSPGRATNVTAQSKPDPLQNYEVQAHPKLISENYDTSGTRPMASTIDIIDSDVTVDISVLDIQGNCSSSPIKACSDTLLSNSDSHVIITPIANKPTDKEVSLAVASDSNFPQTDTAYTMDIAQVDVTGSIGYNSDCIHKKDRGSSMPISGSFTAGISNLPSVETPKTLLHQFSSDQPVQVQVSEQGGIQSKVNITDTFDIVDISFPPKPISLPNPEWGKEISQYKQTKASQKNSTGMEMSSSDSLRRSVRLKGTSHFH